MSYRQRHSNDSRDRDSEREYERRGSPSRHLAQQPQAPSWPSEERQRGKRSGSDPDTEMAEGTTVFFAFLTKSFEARFANILPLR